MQTTDPQDEVFDVVDEDDNVIGTTTRGQAHADPSLIHRSVAILVFRNGKVFLQKRSPTKDRYANYWACSATGHVDSGETYDQAAVRELKEELGLTTGNPPIAMTTRLMEYDNETEMMRFYCYETNDEIMMHPVELSDGKFVDLAEPFPGDMPVTPCTEFIRMYLLERGAIR